MDYGAKQSCTLTTMMNLSKSGQETEEIAGIMMINGVKNGVEETKEYPKSTPTSQPLSKSEPETWKTVSRLNTNNLYKCSSKGKQPGEKRESILLNNNRFTLLDEEAEELKLETKEQ